MMEAQCAVAEPGLAKVKNYFTCLENKKIIMQSHSEAFAILLNSKHLEKNNV